MDKSGAGAGFLRELRFPQPTYIPPASPQSSSLSPEAGTIGQEWLQCQSHKPELNYITYFKSNPFNPVALTETHSAHTIENLTEIYKT
jgi:hypothetical protein